MATGEAPSSSRHDFSVGDSNSSSESLDALLNSSDWTLTDPSGFGSTVDGEQFDAFNSSNEHYSISSYLDAMPTEGIYGSMNDATCVHVAD